MRWASATSFSSRLTMFFFHMPRSSIHPMPNSREATSQARPKSWEISSLMTEIRNGEPESAAAYRCEAAVDTVIAAIPARNSRRAKVAGIKGPPASFGKGANKFITIEKLNGNDGTRQTVREDHSRDTGQFSQAKQNAP